MMSIADLFNTIYTYVISISGIITFASLLIGGFLYLTSVGEPEKINKAKKQISSAFFGLCILFAAFFILGMINPELVSFDLPSLDKIPDSPLNNPSYITLTPNILDRVKKIADEVNFFAERIETQSQEIKNLTDKCNCELAQSLCVCNGGTEQSTCRPLQVYSENENQPCPNSLEIKTKQKNIIAWNDEIVYYKNRAVEEGKDLLLDVSEIKEFQNYYSEALKIEENESAKEYLKERLDQASKEIELKTALSDLLTSLVKAIEKVVPSVSELSELPSRCLSELGDKCQANCKGKCHDIASGCQPEKPSSGNPCPEGEISEKLNIVKSSRTSINSLSDQILEKIKEIVKFKTITI